MIIRIYLSCFAYSFAPLSFFLTTALSRIAVLHSLVRGTPYGVSGLGVTFVQL